MGQFSPNQVKNRPKGYTKYSISTIKYSIKILMQKDLKRNECDGKN